MEDLEMELDLEGDMLVDGGQDELLDLDPPVVQEAAPLEPADGPEAGEVVESAEEAEAQPNKVHIRGLDDLTTTDIKAFVAEHYPAEEEIVVEWIDDTSANLVYPTAESASSALAAIASPSSINTLSSNPLHLCPAKPFSIQPGIALTVRLATSTDRKKARAADASKFYLLHPEHDPRERHRHSQRSSRDRDRRYGRDARDGRASRLGHSRRRSRDSQSPEAFDASMYDDTEATARRHRDSISSYSSDGRSGNGSRRRRRGDRDAAKDGDSYRPRPNRTRSASPQRHGPNFGKELFPKGARHQGAGAGVSAAPSRAKELFQGKSTSSNRAAADGFKKELFPNRVSGAAALLGKSLAVPFVDGGDDGGNGLYSAADGNGNYGFANGAEAAETSTDQMENTERQAYSLRSDRLAAQGRGLSIKGSAGFNIRGAAAARQDATERKVKELFPKKVPAGNQGKELFGGRARERRRAETFY